MILFTRRELQIEIRDIDVFYSLRMQYKTNTHSHNHSQFAASKGYRPHSLAPTICQITKHRSAHLIEHLIHRM